MIIQLTIIIAIIITWSLFSIIYLLYIEPDEMSLNLEEGLLCTLCKLYWYIVWIGLILFIIILLSYLISASIVCHSKNNDYPVCERWNK
jgi:hypothetical protein